MDGLLSVKDAAKMLACSEAMLRKWLHRGLIPSVKIGRVELLYPFPGAEIGEYARRYPNLNEVVWVQEEPRNMGARKFVLPKIRDALPQSVALLDVSRPERSSPAEGYPAAHKAEQERIVAAAYGS